MTAATTFPSLMDTASSTTVGSSIRLQPRFSTAAARPPFSVPSDQSEDGTRSSLALPNSRSWENGSDAFVNITDAGTERISQSLILNPSAQTASFISSERLFVEVCFYARLGFVQPPCCLQCTHRRAYHGLSHNTSCSNWTVWRRNAKIQLHPEQLKGNLVLVQCRAAQQLVQGETVEGYRYHKESKKLSES